MSFLLAAEPLIKAASMHEGLLSQPDDVFAKRHSTREFLPDRLPDHVIRAILEAGMRAPSAKNRQPWHFFILSDPVRKRSLLRMVTTSFHDLDHARSQSIENPEETLKALEVAPLLLLAAYRQREGSESGSRLWKTMDALDREVVDMLSIGAALENMVLRATSLDVGSLWACDVLSAHDAIQGFLGTAMPIVSAVAFGYERFDGRKDLSRRSLGESITWIGDLS